MIAPTTLRPPGRPETDGALTSPRIDEAAKAAVRDPERAGIAAKGVRQKLTEAAGHLPGRHS
ncbi:hypothetical protein [Streptomyces sp. F-1]|uniref:hypothetical protein n=1 Tax=Streptomyces sp. F-1 TaxID=463642 RepID=UPI00086B9066|nr:hypothetical protein [Streptomyces sp. F-1]SFY49510.1 hypothetical protein STEPF1_02749 [Streptomyces sp. F-1]